MTYKSVKETKDLLPKDTAAWLHVERVIREVMDAYRYGEIRTPLFEETELFARGVGESTDIVGKEMYTFTDKGGSSLTLRPEMTAPVIRSFIQHSLGEQAVLNKLYYIGPMFRQERPQAGRFRHPNRHPVPHMKCLHVTVHARHIVQFAICPHTVHVGNQQPDIFRCVGIALLGPGVFVSLG